MRSKLALFLILPLLILTPGCWDLQDVNDTAFVLGIGIDTPSNSDTVKYKVTFEFAKPLSTREHPVTQSLVVSTDADSILQAIQRIQTSISRKISLSHLRSVVIGEDIARKENFRNLTNYLIREPELALRLRLVFVQQAQARDYFYTNPRFEKRLAAEMVAMGMLQKKLDLVRTNNFLDFIIDLNRSNGVASGSRITIPKGDNVAVRDGAAVFKNWKLVAWLNADEAQASNWLLEKNQAIVVAKEGENTYTYQVRKKDTKFKPSLDSGKPSFVVKVTTEGPLMEEAGKNLDFSKPENLKKMEGVFNEAIRKQVTSSIEKSQKEIKADYLGFDKAFQKTYSKEFKSLNWNEIYPTIPIEVEVDCSIKGYGLLK
ncbi:MAG TPA: hypothetical protein DEF42_13620 [Desulfosporosinus sp.]|nr:hypothetical protein [Desulfosporosinus sp.]